ncbi:MAG: PEP-utilizing enzyme [Candidatus Berkelbacteria bacterium]|nr:PEP-utilizing enzyme [Candidatus Berkelbacteria bacterium]
MNNPKWDVDEAQAVWWISPEAAHSLTKSMKNIYGIAFSRNLVALDDKGHFKWCTLTKELENIGKRCLLKFKNKKFRDKIVNGFVKLDKKLDRKIIEYRSKKLVDFSIDELFDYLKFFTDCYKENFDYGFFAEPFDYVLPDVFTSTFKKYNLSPDELAELSAIPGSSYLNLENLRLIKLAIKQKRKQDISSDLQKHFKQYEWIASGHTGKKRITANYFKKKVDELLKHFSDLGRGQKSLEGYEQKTRNLKRRIIDKYHFDTNTQKLIEIVDEIGPLHDKRKELFVKTIFYADDVREEIGKRLGYTLDELQLFEYKELFPLKNGEKLGRNEIEKRQQFIMLDVDRKKGRFQVRSGNEAKKFADREFKQNYEQIDSIEGMSASKGKAKGKVKIIFGESQFSKMKKGDILVTHMTSPRYMSAIARCSAIITDEGGLTCHAAIISREMKKPCIIGTKIATKILKDNDLVQVNANTGEIKIIMRS